MKKFVLMTVGFEEPTEALMREWMAWFEEIQSKVVERVGLMNGAEVDRAGGTENLPFDSEAVTGYVVIEAESMDEAIEIAQKCPAVTSTRVYEVRG